MSAVLSSPMLLSQRLPLRWRSICSLSRTVSSPHNLLLPRPKPRHQWARTCFHPGVSGLARDKVGLQGEKEVTGLDMIKVLTGRTSQITPLLYFRL